MIHGYSKIEVPETEQPSQQIEATHQHYDWKERIGRRISTIMSCIFGPKNPTVESQYIAEEMHELTDQLPRGIYGAFSNRLSYVNPEEFYVGNYLRERLDIDEGEKLRVFTEILQGAYVMIDDDGETYENWKITLREKFERQSSHESSGFDQFAIRGFVVSEFLFSTKIVVDPDTGLSKRYTWFQLERHPMKFGYAIRHLWGWVMYKITHKNQGPYGSSIHREDNNQLQFNLKTSR
jgi:hypothetical protein